MRRRSFTLCSRAIRRQITSRGFCAAAAPVAKKRGRRFLCRFLFKSIAAGCFVPVLYGLHYEYLRAPETKYSLINIGLTIPEEKNLAEKLQIPYGLVGRKIAEAFMKMVFYDENDEEFHSNQPFQDICEAAPKSLVGPWARGNVEIMRGKYDAAATAFEEARALAKAYPKLNSQLLSLLPPKDFDVRDPNSLVWEPQIEEIVSGKLWAISCPTRLFPTGPPRSGLNIQTSVVRLRSGDLVIINPFGSDEHPEVIEFIKSLGNVKAIITTCAGHGIGITKMSKYFPDAELWGTDSLQKHEASNLKWTGFIDGTETEQFMEEFKVKRLNGHQFKEVALLHADTKSLLGITDTTVCLRLDKHLTPFTWMAWYPVSQGMWRRDDLGTLGAQSYNWTLAFRGREKFRKSLEEILSWDFDTLILGHGGRLPGEQAKQDLRIAHKWAWQEIPWHEEAYLFAKYFYISGLIRGFCHKIKSGPKRT